ncbi:MAG TPA: general stress protein [Nakamurella sp.]|nr:general stress protein [Nakamurella sp.]
MTSPMGFRGTAAVPNLPTPPTGFAVAAYPTYAQAQGAVEHLIKRDFSIQDVTIVGSDLQMVERVTGRLTAGKLAAAGAASGAWIGLFVGLLMGFFSPVQGGVVLLIVVSVAIGAAFGTVMGYLGYSVAKGRRDFTSASQVVARRYDVLCQPRTAEQARDLLSRMELGIRG